MSDYTPHLDAGERWLSLTEEEKTRWLNLRDQFDYGSQLCTDILVGDITQEETLSMFAAVCADVSSALMDAALDVMNERSKR